MSSIRTVSEVIAALDTRIDSANLKSVKKGGGEFSYVSWETIVRELDRIFGKLNWSTSAPTLTAGGMPGMYLATLVLSANAIDDETGELITKTVAGFGRGVAMGQGGSASDNLQIHDTAASAAGSDAFSKASKLLGDAFALFLYDKSDPASASSESSAARASKPAGATAATGGAGRPSKPQTYHLTQAGFTEGEINSMSFNQWKPALDEYFNNGKNPINTAKYLAPAVGAPAPF